MEKATLTIRNTLAAAAANPYTYAYVRGMLDVVANCSIVCLFATRSHVVHKEIADDDE